MGSVYSKRISKQLLSAMCLVMLASCGQDAGDLSKKLQDGAFTVSQYGCSGQQMVRPSENGLILQIQFTPNEMITSQASAQMNNNYYNNNYNNNLNNNYYQGNYFNNNNSLNNNYGMGSSFTEVDRDVVRYLDKQTLEAVATSNGQVDRFNVSLRDDDRYATLTSQSTGSRVSCPEGSNFIIELQR